MKDQIKIYDVSLQVRIAAGSENEAKAIGYNLLLSRSQNQNNDHPVEGTISQANLDGLFEERPKANLGDLFEDGERNAD